MASCDRCANKECIESCIDCVCATCRKHDRNDECGLGMPYADWFEEAEAPHDA